MAQLYAATPLLFLITMTSLQLAWTQTYSIPRQMVTDCSTDDSQTYNQFYDSTQMACFPCRQNRTFQATSADGEWGDLGGRWVGWSCCKVYILLCTAVRNIHDMNININYGFKLIESEIFLTKTSNSLYTILCSSSLFRIMSNGLFTEYMYNKWLVTS